MPDERGKETESLAHTMQITEAIDLRIKDADWQGFEALLANEATLRLSQGGYAEVLNWLDRIPEVAVGHVAGFSYWKGAAAMPSCGFIESRRWFEQAFSLYKDRDDIVGQLLSWASIIDTIFLEWADFSQLRKWIPVGEQLLDVCADLPEGEVEQRVVGAMFTALMQGQPDHPDIRKWEVRLFALIRRIEDDNRRLMIGTSLFIYYTKWLGEHARAEIVADMLRPPPERLSQLTPMARILLAMIDCTFHWNRYAIADAVQAAREGMKVAAQTGIHTWEYLLNIQPVYAGLSANECGLADPYLGRLKELIPRRGALDQSHYHYLMAWREMLADEPYRAMEHLGQCLSLVDAQSGPMQHTLTCLAVAYVRHALGEDDEIPPLLTYAHEMAQKTGSPLLEFMTCYAEAAFAMDSSDSAACLAPLGKALALAKSHDYLNFTWCLPDVLTRLCIKAMEEGIETEFVHKLIRVRRIVPEYPPMHLEQWPWPLRIYTLGRFKLEKDGEPLEYGWKVQRKPLELLKVLIALGGRDVPASQLSDILWPAADGDKAHSSFTTALSRLRKLIGNDALIFVNGCLTLDTRHCWVDAWAMDRSIDEAHGATDTKRVETLLRKSTDLYRGPFLNIEDDAFWLRNPRDRMRKRLIHALLVNTRFLNNSGHGDTDVFLCRKVIANDPRTQPLFERYARQIGGSLGGDFL